MIFTSRDESTTSIRAESGGSSVSSQCSNFPDCDEGFSSDKDKDSGILSLNSSLKMMSSSQDWCLTHISISSSFKSEYQSSSIYPSVLNLMGKILEISLQDLCQLLSTFRMQWR